MPSWSPSPTLFPTTCVLRYAPCKGSARPHRRTTPTGWILGQEYARRIVAAAQRMNTVVEDLLAYSPPQSGQPPVAAGRSGVRGHGCPGVTGASTPSATSPSESAGRATAGGRPSCHGASGRGESADERGQVCGVRDPARGTDLRRDTKSRSAFGSKTTGSASRRNIRSVSLASSSVCMGTRPIPASASASPP